MAEGTGSANKSRTLAFRDSVVLALNERGLGDAARPSLPEHLSAVQRQAADRGEILGLPWVIHVHRQRTMDLSGSQDMVRDRAASQGRELYATVHHRKGHSVEDAYVVLPVSVFARALAGI